MATTNDIGKHAEQFARTYLQENGLTFQQANFHCRFGEIDLIMSDSNGFIFVEVKYRKSHTFGGAISAVSLTKQHKIKKSAQMYLQQQGLNEYNTSCRFDVVALEGSTQNPDINWLKNAF